MRADAASLRAAAAHGSVAMELEGAGDLGCGHARPRAGAARHAEDLLPPRVSAIARQGAAREARRGTGCGAGNAAHGAQQGSGSRDGEPLGASGRAGEFGEKRA